MGKEDWGEFWIQNREASSKKIAEQKHAFYNIIGLLLLFDIGVQPSHKTHNKKSNK